MRCKHVFLYRCREKLCVHLCWHVIFAASSSGGNALARARFVFDARCLNQSLPLRAVTPEVKREVGVSLIRKVCALLAT